MTQLENARKLVEIAIDERQKQLTRKAKTETNPMIKQLCHEENAAYALIKQMYELVEKPQKK